MLGADVGAERKLAEQDEHRLIFRKDRELQAVDAPLGRRREQAPGQQPADAPALKGIDDGHGGLGRARVVWKANEPGDAYAFLSSVGALDECPDGEMIDAVAIGELAHLIRRERVLVPKEAAVARFGRELSESTDEQLRVAGLDEAERDRRSTGARMALDIAGLEANRHFALLSAVGRLFRFGGHLSKARALRRL